MALISIMGPAWVPGQGDKGGFGGVHKGVICSYPATSNGVTITLSQVAIE